MIILAVSTKTILVKNTFWLGLVEAISKIIMFVVTIKIVRYLGPADFGTLNIATAYVAIFMILSDFGLGIVTTREVAKHKDETNKYLNNLLGLKLILSGIIAVLIVGSLLFIPTSSGRTLILAVMIYNLMQNMGTVFYSVFSAWERMDLVFVCKLTYYLGILAAAVTIIYLKGNALDIILAYGLTTTLSVIFTAYQVIKMGFKIELSFDKQFLIKILIETLPFMGLAVVGTLFANNDTLLIGRFFGSEKTGFYQSAYKILFAFQSINVINNAIFPRINVLIHENKTETLKKLIKMVVGLSVIGLVPMGMAIWIFQDMIISLIYGNAYNSAAPAMAILVWAGIVNFYRILTSNILFAKNRQKYVFYSVTVGFVVNVMINYWIMPNLNFVIAAWSLLISESCILLMTMWYLNKKE